ncbi:hypothetical protein NDU88_001352 [Pleurodeles waltl]|uniref:Uncharacterized protein n=1 Tax=Pleurodeles waltl TaxID=8319 RepID=A0AAV7KT86_PLEWA|nr:hypothetical protein NDU88_001352 [Pleurodeles waltl]
MPGSGWSRRGCHRLLGKCDGEMVGVVSVQEDIHIDHPEVNPMSEQACQGCGGGEIAEQHVLIVDRLWVACSGHELAPIMESMLVELRSGPDLTLLTVEHLM